MALFAIGDLHLSIGVPDKPMGIFKGWEAHQEQLVANWQSLVSPDDTVVLMGDSSWAMRLDEALPDFQFIEALNGKKIIMKGNHDYWWTSLTKMQTFFSSNSLNSLSILHNNCFEYEDYAICGSRGWVSINGEPAPADEKVVKREAIRLEASIRAGIALGKKPLVFLHYPPVFPGSCNYDILDVLYRYNIDTCYYAHIHGYACKNAIQGISDGIRFELLSSDYLRFTPKQIIK